MKFGKKGLVSIILSCLFFVAAIVVFCLNLTIWSELSNHKLINALIGVIIFVGIIFLVIAFFDKEALGGKKKIITTKMMAVVGVMSAISAVLYLFVKFPLPIFPSFLDIQVSEIPALIVGYAYGPFAGVLVLLIRFIIKLPQSGTFCVGEIGDLIIGIALVIPSSLIYRKYKTFKGAILSFIISAFLATFVAMLANWIILIPCYVYFYFGGNFEAVVKICAVAMPKINATNFMPLYLFGAVLPFNLLRYSLVGVITFLIYKRIHILINRI